MPPRQRLEEGIYADAYGLAATVKVAGVQKERRFHPDTPREQIRSWRVQTRAALDLDRPQKVATAGTLTRDGLRALKRLKGTPGYKADKSHLRAWLHTLGRRPRALITTAEINAHIVKWRSSDPPVAAKTIRHRLRVLRAVYLTLDGPKAKCPVDDAEWPSAPTPSPAAVPKKVIEKVAAKLKSAGRSKDYARFCVLATTGQRPAQLMRTLPADVDLSRKVWFVRAAKGGHQIPMPLAPDAVAAFRAFTLANAWGAYDTTLFAQVLRAHGWPKGVRPYALRHTFAIDLLLSGDADLGDVQGLLGHRQINTTRKFYGPIQVARLKRAVSGRKLAL